jgi:hypothetical protein
MLPFSRGSQSRAVLALNHDSFGGLQHEAYPLRTDSSTGEKLSPRRRRDVCFSFHEGISRQKAASDHAENWPFSDIWQNGQDARSEKMKRIG